MSDVYSIKIRGISKKYTLGGEKHHYHTFRETVVQSIKSSFHSIFISKRIKTTNEFWALKNVTFDVKKGEVIGIIGRNGAGKSTLLKILSKITSPTEGEIDMFGRVGSLLEVGTGFHPELTGRENIFLSGSILGMKRREIEDKFDEIVNFSEIGKFIDTPVKRYSSGMYVRLAFAVAAHLETEILLIDEILAVGDAAFQKKCLRKMNSIAEQGMTVLFVSHNMAAIQNICNKGVVLDKGAVVYTGDIDEAIRYYLEESNKLTNNFNLETIHREGSQRLIFKNVEIVNNNGKKIIFSGDSLNFILTLNTNEKITSSHVNIGIGIDNFKDERLITLFTKFDKSFLNEDFIFVNETKLVCTTGKLLLTPSIYKITLYSDIDGELSDHIVNQIQLEISENDFFGTGHLPSVSQGSFLINQTWHKVDDNIENP